MGRYYTTMKKVRELLELKFKFGLSAREASHRLGIGKTAASEYVAGFKSSGLTLEEALALSDTELAGILSLKKLTKNERYVQLYEKFDYFEKELKRRGVTLQLLWEEYRQTWQDGYEYSQFCYHYEKWRKTVDPSMRMEHIAGDKMYVDFAGGKRAVVNPKTGEITEYEIFVAVLGSSQYAYIEAVATQNKADWVMVNENALRFFGGVPRAIVPDCLKSAVIKADKYEPTINQTYSDFAHHFGTTILPARALHPKDKPLVEGFVKIAYMRIYAPLRNEVYHSLSELNQALWAQLDKHNQKNFQGRKFSRNDQYLELERGALMPLPVASYNLKEFLKTRVQYNYYVYFKPDMHYYSVPIQYTGKMVDVTYNNHLVEIFHDNIRIAMHIRDFRLYEYTVIKEHRSANHDYIAQWSTERYLNWAEKIGSEARDVVQKIFESKAHPEQGFRSCMGILNLAKTHPKEDFLKACKKATYVGCVSYKFINNTLKNRTFNLEIEEELKQLGKINFHENIRGKEDYN